MPRKPNVETPDQREKRLKKQRAYNKRWRKAQAKMVKGAARTLKRSTPPHLLNPDFGKAAARSAAERNLPQEARDWKDVCMAQQGIIARLLTIIEAVVELG